MNKQIEKLKEKINEAVNSIEKEKSETGFIFSKALESVLLTIEEIEKEDKIKVGNYYFAWNTFEDVFIYGQLDEIDKADQNLPYHIYGLWFECISTEFPKDLVNPLNN